MTMQIDDSNMDGFSGVTAGTQEAERWQYPGVGYNATSGTFYIGEEEAKTLEIVPFAMRQCKEITDLNGVIHRYPIKTRKADMAEGDMTTRLQVVGVVNGELYVFGARSWTARAAWANPMGGPYHDARFEGGIWPRLMNHIKDVQTTKGKRTAPLCWRVKLEVGDLIDLSSAANAKQKSQSRPIKAVSLSFVGAEKSVEYERLYVDEAISEWVAEWNKQAVGEPAAPMPGQPPAQPLETADELIPF